MFAYLAFAVVFFLVPASLVSAELGGAFADTRGGIYVWVDQAFGSRWGFLAIWLQWVQNIAWFPVGLTFGGVALAYACGRPELANNGTFIGTFCIIAYWLATAVVLQGVRVFARYANLTFIAGTLLPGLSLVGLLGYWVAAGRPIGWQHLSSAALSDAGHPRFWPLFHGLGSVAFLAGVVLLFAGVEVQAVHVVEMRKPARGYPSAIGLAAALSLAVFALGAVPIAAILPGDRIALQSGVFDAFGAVIGDAWHLAWLTRLLSLLVGLGAIGGVFAWLGSPAKGLLAAAADGELPLLMQAANRHGMPKYIILGQGVGTTLMSALYFGNENVAIEFFLLSAMTIALYVIAYMLMYAAVIRLRYARPGLARPFRVPGGAVGIWLVAGVGFAGVLFSFVAAFVPPDQLPVGSPIAYTALVLVGTVVFCGMPLLLHQTRRSRLAGAAAASDAPPDDAAAVKPILEA